MNRPLCFSLLRPRLLQRWRRSKGKNEARPTRRDAEDRALERHFDDLYDRLTEVEQSLDVQDD